MDEGVLDGSGDGTVETEGTSDGVGDGSLEGAFDTVGRAVGTGDGAVLGVLVGKSEGTADATFVGEKEGDLESTAEGVSDEAIVGDTVSFGKPNEDSDDSVGAVDDVFSDIVGGAVGTTEGWSLATETEG